MESVERLIKECYKCGTLMKLSCETVKKGNCNVLVLGESPAKDGWIISKKAFYNSKGKLQASGKVLEKLLNLIGLSIDDIYFTEVCKCVILDRNKLRECSNNCKVILFKQIENLECDVILTMGVHPTETLLGYEIKKLKDYVGKKYEIMFGKKKKTVIPIYHTSPANPLCYKGNESVFVDIIKGEVK